MGLSCYRRTRPRSAIDAVRGVGNAAATVFAFGIRRVRILAWGPGHRSQSTRNGRSRYNGGKSVYELRDRAPARGIEAEIRRRIQFQPDFTKMRKMFLEGERRAGHTSRATANRVDRTAVVRGGGPR